MSPRQAPSSAQSGRRLWLILDAGMRDPRMHRCVALAIATLIWMRTWLHISEQWRSHLSASRSAVRSRTCSASLARTPLQAATKGENSLRYLLQGFKHLAFFAFSWCLRAPLTVQLPFVLSSASMTLTSMMQSWALVQKPLAKMSPQS